MQEFLKEYYGNTRLNLLKEEYACIFVLQFDGKSFFIHSNSPLSHEADTKGARRVAEGFYTYIVS